MDPSKFAKLDELFYQAMGLEPGQRGAFLEAACEHDASMHQILERLLANAARTHDVFEESPTDFIAASDSSTPDDSEELVGQTLGMESAGGMQSGYEIQRLLGRGGMGVVYLARQRNPERHVALKVIRPELATPTWIRRLRHEAQVLAILNHPGIAHFYEMGAADGPVKRHFYAMEYVDGQPLTGFATAHNLKCNQRLELMGRVCEALQHAHDHGVIHRDLKPGNIIVDAAGQPKILDFGIARLTNASIEATTMHTAPGQIFGTLQYMSPEQASGETALADVRSDVYALGVILFELLCGRLPHELSQKQNWEAVRIIREEEPKRLGSVDRSLRGDVETIVSKALERDPTRRYLSARQMGEDIRRYLHNEPITARPPSTWYEVRKFASRNKTVVGFVAAIIVITTTGFIWSLVLLARVKDRNARATKLAETFSDVLTFADPSQNPYEFTSRDWLGAYNRQLDESFPDDDEVQARIGLKIGRGYVGIGEYATGVQRMERSYQAFVRAREYGPRHRATLDALVRLANAKNFTEERIQALDAATLAVSIGPERGDPWTDPLSIRALSELSRSLSRLESWHPDAVHLAFTAMRLADASSGVDEDTRFDVMVNTMRVLTACHQTHGIIGLHDQLLAALMRYHPNDTNHPRVIAEVYEFACVLIVIGKHDLAEPWLTTVMESRQKRYGENHFEFAITLLSMGNLREAQGRLREAEELFDRYVACTRRNWPGRPDKLAQPLCTLYRVRLRLGWATLEETQQVLDSTRPYLVDLAEKRANWLVTDGLCRLRSGAAADAWNELGEALQVLREANGEDSIATVRTRGLLEEIRPLIE